MTMLPMWWQVLNNVAYHQSVVQYSYQKDCVLAQRSVSDMLARCCKIVGHYKHSHLAAERLQDILSLPYDKLMQDEPTR